MTITVTDLTKNGTTSDNRIDVNSTPPSAGFSNVSQDDNSAVNMNCPEYKQRGYRADQLIEMAGNDGYSLHTESPRFDKMKG